MGRVWVWFSRGLIALPFRVARRAATQP